MIKKIATIVLLTTAMSLSGCAGLSALGSAVKGLGGTNNGTQVNTEDVVVGKKEETNTTNLGGDETVTQTAEQIINQNDIPILYVLLFMLMAGWAIPSPQEMGRGVLNFIRALWGKDPI